MKLTRLSLAIAALLSMSAIAYADPAADADADADQASSGSTDADNAKQADQANSTSLEAITVTARRRDETLQDVPIAITALSARTLETLNVQNLGDLQGNVPNLVIHDARGSNSTITTYIRGIGQSDPTWGDCGVSRIPIWGANDEARAVVLQSDGKVLVLGTALDPREYLINDYMLEPHSYLAVIRLNADGTLPRDERGMEESGMVRNWWIGLSMLHTLFVREHNAICDRLAQAYPDWDDNRLFNVARLINAAVMAKVHTVGSYS